MMIFFALISFFASVAGAISGIGGGVILKPLMDMAHILSIEEINFLSGCTVLSMTAISVGKSLLQKDNAIDVKNGTPLAVGAALGGIAGKVLFSVISNSISEDSFLGLLQSVLMLVMVLGTFLYTLFEKRIDTWHMSGVLSCTFVGLALGLQSGFLGIGGGPANLLVLSFFFSMERKRASVNSLYIIFFSQLFSVGVAVADGIMLEINSSHLILLVMAGILGGTVGGYVYKSISAEKIKAVFSGMLIMLAGLNIWNIIQFTGMD